MIMLPPLWLRITIGLLIFATLGGIDLAKNGRAATRWREYAFLVFVVVLAIVYGMLNDQITVTISPEYFAYGKGLADKLGPWFDRDMLRFRWEAAKVGAAATWGAGLLMGVTLLIANNPSKFYPRLPYRSLFGAALLILGSCIAISTVLGTAGYLGALTATQEDFVEMVRHDQFRPYRFMAVYGVHLGGYIGGVTGNVLAAVLIRRGRQRLVR